MRTKILLFAVSILIIASIGCINKSEDKDGSSGVPTEPSEDISIAQTHGIGRSINDGDTKMTLNRVRYTKTIHEKNNLSSVSAAEAGNQFIIINITIENIGIDKKLQYPVSQFIILDTDENIEKSPYEVDVVASSNLKEYFNGDSIRPGDKRQGELAFQVPEGEKGLHLRFEYSPDSSKGSTLEFFTLDQ